MLVTVIKENKINNLNMLSIAAIVAKHVEENDIIFNFSNDFKIDDIPDNNVIDLLENIE